MYIFKLAYNYYYFEELCWLLCNVYIMYDYEFQLKGFGII